MNFKKILCILLSFIFLLCSCQNSANETTIDNNFILTSDSINISTSMYSYMVFNAYNALVYYVDDSSLPAEEWTLGGNNFHDSIDYYAKMSMFSLISTESLCKKYDIKIDTEKYAEELEYSSKYWEKYSSDMEDLGIDKDSYDFINNNTLKAKTLNDVLFSQGGALEIAEDDLLNFFKENYRKIYLLTMPIQDKKVDEKYADSLVSKINNGYDFSTLVYEEYAKQSDETIEEIKEEMQNLGGITYIYKNDSSFSSDFINTVFETKELEKAFNVYYEDMDGQFYFIYKVVDLLGDGSEYDESKDSIKQAMTNDTISKLIEEELENIKYTVNEDLLKEYSVINILNKRK